MSFPEKFKCDLSNIVEAISLNESNWSSEKWKSLFEVITEEVLIDAFEKHDLVKSTFPELKDMITRNCKSIKRVEKKKTEQYPNKENYFKVVADFLAVRINCDVNQIKDKIDYVKRIVMENEGVLHIRGSSENRPYGFFMDQALLNQDFKDITQYVYVYIEKIGYVIEFQIGHEFASYTFSSDSALRDDKNCGQVDLWNKGFYGDVKTHILNKANNVEFNHEDKGMLFIKCSDVHDHTNIPNELVDIIVRL